MNIGHFYFLDDAYFTDFRDPNLERNKETIGDVLHSRPCFYSFIDNTTQIYWMIPISSKVAKFKQIHQDKVNKNGKCDTLVFGYVMGHEKAFLIQNMCPAIPKYFSNEYIDKYSNVPVSVDGVLEKELIQKSSLVLALARQGKRVIFPNVLLIETELKKQLGN